MIPTTKQQFQIMLFLSREYHKAVFLAQYCSPCIQVLLVISVGNMMCHSRVMQMTSKSTLVSFLFNLVGKINVCNPWEHVYLTYLWMRTNLLKLNDDKTELIVLGTRQQLSKEGEVSIMIGNDTISTVPSVQNLGIHFDKELKWIVHINHLTSNLYYILRKVAHVQHLLNEEATKTIIQALVLSKIDYCNSIYQGAPTYAINKLQ